MNRSIVNENKALVKRLIDEAFNGRNLALLHEEFVNHQDLLAVEAKKCPAIFEELYARMFECFPDIEIINHMMLADGDKIILYDTLSGTNTGPMPDS